MSIRDNTTARTEKRTDIINLPYAPRSIEMMEEARGRILVLDGAMGTMIQQMGLTPKDFHGERWADHDVNLAGCNDVLTVTRPDVIAGIHRAYMEAGADIIETDSFNSNRYSLDDYGLGEAVEELNSAAARVAREAADRFMTDNPGRKVWVAGSIGPSGKSLSMAGSMEGERVDWDAMTETIGRQAEALLRGGADLLLIETIYDGLNAKAAAWACRRAMERVGWRVPLMLSVTLTESGRLLSGMTPEAFVAAMAHTEPWALGLNCSFGADELVKHLAAFESVPSLVSIYPNAGLPDELGRYTETPEMMAEHLRGVMSRGMINIVGGCCGTTPAHIAALAGLAKDCPPRVVPSPTHRLTLAGLEPLEAERDTTGFINVGERCNVAGSRKFLRLIKEGNIAEAVAIASAQVNAGARIIDINMDDAMLDSTREMTRFVARLTEDPAVGAVPLMIDSSRHETITEALKLLQGRAIVNSISLKEGEEKFLEKAREIRELGAAVVVMAFDEEGQATTVERRVGVARRAYNLLTERLGFPPEAIIIDPNVLAVATGMEEHDRYGADFIDAVGEIKSTLPYAKVSGGISNLSFSFRGNNYVREAMHSVFLYHAIGKGMDMAIVNAAAAVPVDQIDSDLRDAIEDVLIRRPGPEATERLIAVAADVKERKEREKNGEMPEKKEAETLAPRTPSEQLTDMVVRGVTDGLTDTLDLAMAESGSALPVIDGPLMAGMNRVGELFGAGRLFLPQVVKSAQVMKLAVAHLTPSIERERASQPATKGGRAPRMVLATVKGDVHDIGKNIVAVIMKCNGFEVTDLGVMVPGEKILEAAEREHADCIGLSGLITPSLSEMASVAQLMEERGIDLPLFVGGATTSELHTAVKIAPALPSGLVVHTHDAASLPGVAKRLLNPEVAAEASEEIISRQRKLREEYEQRQATTVTIEEARKHRHVTTEPSAVPQCPGVSDMQIAIKEAAGLINWRAFMAAWKLDSSLASAADVHSCDKCRTEWLAGLDESLRTKAREAAKLIDDAREMLCRLDEDNFRLSARVAILPVRTDGNETLTVQTSGGEVVELVMPRRRVNPPTSDGFPSLADYLCKDGDYVGFFAVTAGKEIEGRVERLRAEGREYDALLLQSLADRLAEAATELVHHRTRTTLWGYAPDEGEMTRDRAARQDYQGIRPAVGYPSIPRQQEVFTLDRILHYGDLGIRLTENGALSPSATTTGMIFASPSARYFSVK